MAMIDNINSHEPHVRCVYSLCYFDSIFDSQITRCHGGNKSKIIKITIIMTMPVMLHILLDHNSCHCAIAQSSSIHRPEFIDSKFTEMFLDFDESETLRSFFTKILFWQIRSVNFACMKKNADCFWKKKLEMKIIISFEVKEKKKKHTPMALTIDEQLSNTKICTFY